MDPFFLIITLLSFTSALVFSLATRGVHFFGTDTDTEKQAQVAAHSKDWRWPSDMHRSEYAKTKTYMKDVVILLLAITQKITRDTTTDHTLLVLSAWANAIVTILIYSVAVFYWGPLVAFAVSLLFLTSLWVWQIALIGGHITVAMILFLFSIFTIQQASAADGTAQLLWLGVAGLAYGMTQFASASSRKFWALFLGALIFARYGQFIQADTLAELVQAIKANHSIVINIILPALTILGLITLKLTYRPLVTALYNRKGPKVLQRIIHEREKFSLEHYLRHAKKQVREHGGRIFSLVAFFILAVNLIGFDYLIPLAVGFAIAVTIFIVPNVKANLTNYFKYYYLPKGSKNRFRMYNNYFNSIGKEISFARPGKPVERTGWDWVAKYLWRIIPFHVTLVVLSFIFLMYQALQSEYPAFGVTTTLLLTALALSPIAWGEFTKGPQLGRSYSPGLLGLLLLIGAGISQAHTLPYFWHVLSGFMVVAFIWAAHVFLTDVYPARMATRSLVRLLKEKGIKKIYTYDSSYADSFVNNILPENQKDIEIIHVERLADIPHGQYVAIPGTSQKSLNLESSWEAIKGGDYTKDEILNDLIETKKIETIALSRFHTFGTSPIWVHESEITSYRDLIVHDITPKDRYRALAWLINTKDLKTI